MPNVITCFVDANVWFSAALSKKGSSFLIMESASLGLIKIFTSKYILDEVQRNLLLKNPEHLAGYYSLLSAVSPDLQPAEVSENTEKFLHSLVPESDVPVLASAILSKSAYLVSLDKKHIVNSRLRKAGLPFEIVLPGEMLGIIRKTTEDSNK